MKSRIAPFVLLAAVAALAQPPANPQQPSSEAPKQTADAGPKNLEAEERERIKDLHLRAWQTVVKIREADLDRIKAQVELDGINREIERVTRELTETHQAQGYVLAPDFRWVKPQPPQVSRSASGGDGPATRNRENAP